MEEAQRLLTVSVWKLYRCRVRRGGLRLHRSLQLSLLVRAARHRYLSARAAAGVLPGPEITGAAVNAATPGPEITGAAVNAATPGPEITGAAVNGAIPVTEITGAARNGAIPGPEITGAARNGATPGPEITGAAVNAATPGPEITGAAVNGATPGPEITGTARNGAIPGPEITGAAVNGATPGPGSGLSGELRCPNTPSSDRPSNRTEEEWGNPLRDCTGDHRNAPSGAPCSEWYRGCPRGRPSQEPPSPANRDRDPALSADPNPANRDPPPAAPGPPRPTGAPRAGQKRRSSGSAGPGRGPVPSKRARLEAEAPPVPPGPPGRCSGPPAAAFGFLVRAVGAC
ncbi:basic proline-rich protein-like [Molothrus ater]|uniref:basic proline-rich protein-like n=1 Tax=Molothrus ater TaxID=84834 RepID=UPI00174D716B|nr:basic proline-rich protein-like [Molothrus ater]